MRYVGLEDDTFYIEREQTFGFARCVGDTRQTHAVAFLMEVL